MIKTLQTAYTSQLPGATGLQAVPRWRRLSVAAVLSGLLGGLASAQTAGSSVGLDLTSSISAFGTYMGGTISTNSPTLFGILALAVGFYFLWGRVRSLF